MVQKMSKKCNSPAEFPSLVLFFENLTKNCKMGVTVTTVLNYSAGILEKWKFHIKF